MVDVFISYSRADREMVRRLAEAVKREGYSVWWDDALPPHLAYGDVIAEKIGAAKAAIVVWSHDAAASEWVRAEADLARNQKKLIQASIDDRMPPMPFNQIHFVSIGDWRGEDDHPGWIKVKESLEALCGPGAGPAPYPMPVTPPPAAPHKWHKLLIAVIATSFLAIAAVSLLAWMRASPPVPVVNQVSAPANGIIAAPPAPRPEPVPATPRPVPKAEPREQPRQTRPPVPAATPNVRAVRGYCLGPGRGTAQCRQLRARYGR